MVSRRAALMTAGAVSHEDSTNLYYVFMALPTEVQAANPFRTWDWTK